MTAPLVWIDLEMTGLDPRRCRIVEIATLVTDSELNIVGEGPNLIVHQPEEALTDMDPYVVKMHTSSGLLPKIRASKVSLEDAEAETIAFLKAHCEAGKSPLCGNSIWKDRQFIEAYMPKLTEFLHYRNIDVSTIKELGRRWYPGKHAPNKAETHRALDDIKESIEELKFYRQAMFA